MREDERRSLSGIPGLISVPGLREIFGANDKEAAQTEIVMLLTPRIIRTHELTAQDLSPIYVGTNQSFGLTGPPPFIAAPEQAAPANQPAPAGPAVPPQGTPVPTAPAPGPAGAITTPAAPAQPPPPDAQRDLTRPDSVTTLTGPAQLSVTVPTADVRVAGGPYTVPVFVSGANRLSTITVTVTYNPAILRVRMVQEGSFLRQGGVNVVFTNRPDQTTGRLDLTFVRTGDAVGASGSGLLASIIFDAIGSGTSQLAITGVAADPAGSTLPLQFTPASVVVR